MQPGLHVGPLTNVHVAALVSVPCHWIPFPYLDFLGGPQWEKRYLALLGLDVPRVGVPLLLERGEGNGGKGS